MQIVPLSAEKDIDRVATFYQAAPEYWVLADGKAPDRAKAAAFFTDGPPGCDPAQSYRLGLELGGRLSGVAELSFGFPEAGDAYLGLMMLGSWAQGHGHGRRLLAHVEKLAKARGAQSIYLAVIEANTRGWAFWTREGFKPTGRSGEDDNGVVVHRLHRLVKTF